MKPNVYGDPELQSLANELLSGTPVNVFMMADESPPPRYLAKPLTDYFDKAFRER